jgi:ELP3 family radical SAM enzyme/protein acetyltransferase
VNALKLLKDNCFKVDVHWMPDLPGSTVEKDRDMFNTLLGVISKSVNGHEHKYVMECPELQADQWKIYPCEVTPWTVIEKWYKSGKYKPYAEQNNGKLLIDLICDIKRIMFPWIRLNRIVRDIPNDHILGGNSVTNLRQHILAKMKACGDKCMCIRCREVGLNDKNNAGGDAVLVIREYNGNDGIEYFISYESPDYETLFGFCRLRISDTSGSVFECLEKSGLVRELHVYGQLVPTWSNDSKKSTQHMGFGKKLMNVAEKLTRQHGLSKIAVIAGIGTRNYYRNLGYTLKDTYLVKDLSMYRIPLFMVYWIVFWISMRGIWWMWCVK